MKLQHVLEFIIICTTVNYEKMFINTSIAIPWCIHKNCIADSFMALRILLLVATLGVCVNFFNLSKSPIQNILVKQVLVRQETNQASIHPASNPINTGLGCSFVDIYRYRGAKR